MRTDGNMELSCYIAGAKAPRAGVLTVRNPYNGQAVGDVLTVGAAQVGAAIEAALAWNQPLTRNKRVEILEAARAMLGRRKVEFSRLITSESGICLRDSEHEVGRALDVLRFAAAEALHDDGQIFSGDTSSCPKARKSFTFREPLGLAVAVTPFNHPLNQIVHKVAPAIAAGTPLIVKPSEKTPLTALRFTELLYDAGLPGPMLSMLVGPTEEVAARLAKDPRVELLLFTGSMEVGQKLAASNGYKRLVLELGGNDPLIVLEDADLDLAAELAAEGAFRNSGQRCTAVKRILVHERVLEDFTRRLVEKARTYTCGDPFDPETRVGTVIDEAAAIALEKSMRAAVAKGARLLWGGERRGALLTPAVLDQVPRDADLVNVEAFGPLAPIMPVRDLDDAIALANATSYGLSAGVVTNRMDWATAAIRRLRAGTVNINEIPGYRLENSPFGGVKASGLGIKEGVTEVVKLMSHAKTFSMPWPQ